MKKKFHFWKRNFKAQNRKSNKPKVVVVTTALSICDSERHSQIAPNHTRTITTLHIYVYIVSNEEVYSLLGLTPTTDSHFRMPSSDIVGFWKG